MDELQGPHVTSLERWLAWGIVPNLRDFQVSFIVSYPDTLQSTNIAMENGLFNRWFTY